jgi:hypothetical protein
LPRPAWPEHLRADLRACVHLNTSLFGVIDRLLPQPLLR